MARETPETFETFETFEARLPGPPGPTVAHELAPWVPPRALTVATSTAGLLVVAAYAGGVLLPYLAAGLHHLPLTELTSGAYDPKDLWPAAAGTPGALLHLAGLLAATLGFLLTVPAAAVSAFALRAARARHRPVAVHAVVLVLVLAATVVRFTPLGAALATWVLD